MKKIILIILGITLLVNPLKVNADTNNVETKYKFYIEKKNGEYLNNLEESNYQYKDKNDIKYYPYSKWQDKCEVDTNIYNIETKTFYEYQNISKIRFITLEEFKQNININNLNIYSNNKLIDYTLIKCPNCNPTLNNISSNNILKLKLSEPVDPSTLTINIKVDKIEQDLAYQITASKDATLNEIILQKEINNKEIIKVDETWIKNYIFDTPYIVETKQDETPFVKYIQEVPKCHYRLFELFNYNIEKVYYDDNYHTNVEGYIKDENQSKKFYKSKVTNNIPTFTKTKPINKKNQKLDTTPNIKDNKITKKTKVEEKKETPLVNTLKVSNNKSIVKYLILVVIGLTVVYIGYLNKKNNHKKSR